ncbi:hypothetical protein [Clostridium estertheticum]|uniref:hypothetical protein n=1 Tax=Clostridium estertheticum TaxID=238834 RepID=UPI001CF328FD|nr:hypothetical protein [Clostridium estertheticum]MCB2357164.1 hypothetical protein [Clostridium estertheticum]WAG40379.1 hypothetical protein LL065_19235 [Clostridium estertheticum]
MNFIGVDVHKEKLTVASIDEKLNIEFIDNMVPDVLLNYLSNREVLIDLYKSSPSNVTFEFSIDDFKSSISLTPSEPPYITFRINLT